MGRAVTMPFKLRADDLETVLALARGRTLARAAERLGVDASTVLRNLQRVERGLEQRLFERTRSGYRTTEIGRALSEHAEHVETELDAARSVIQSPAGQIAGIVRLTTTDALLHGLVGPSLLALEMEHPLLSFELNAGNEFVDLTRRDADIAVRATRKPPDHLIGKHIGPIEVALFASRRCKSAQRYEDVESGRARWIAPDDQLSMHPSVVWRKRHFPKVEPHYKVNSILTVMELVASGLGVGVLPLFLATGSADLVQLGDVLPDSRTELWILTSREAMRARRTEFVFKYLASTLTLKRSQKSPQDRG